MCFDVKWDRRHKARLVTGRNWTAPDFQHDFNGTLLPESIRIGLFMAAHSKLDVVIANISNAYLYTTTREKVYTIGGPKFGALEGRTMVINKAYYGLRASNAALGEHLSASLKKLGWHPSRANPKLWYRDAGDHYEFLATYVDDLIFFTKEPTKCIEEVAKDFDLKGIGTPEYFLGGNIGITKDSTIFSGAQKYTETITEKSGETPGPTATTPTYTYGSQLPSRTRQH